MKKEINLFDRMMLRVDPNGVMTREERNLAIRLHRYNGNWIIKRYSVELIQRLVDGNGTRGYTLNDVQLKNARQAIKLFNINYKTKSKGLFAKLMSLIH